MFRPMGDVVRSTRDVPPLSYIMNIEPFSLLSKLLTESGEDKYESSEFEAGGHKWKMIVYPNGDQKNDVRDYVSLYLQMTDATPSSDVNVMVNFFVLNRINNKYATFEDNRIKSFNAMNNMRGISRMLSLDAFQDSSNGYISDDCCTFGTELVVVETERKREKLTILDNPENATFTWKITKFSTLKDVGLYSEVFTVGGFKWNLSFYPNGTGEDQGRYVSLFLGIADFSDLRPGWKVYVIYKLIIKDQIHNKHEKNRVKHWFSASDESWGYSNFVSLTDMEDKKRGFILNDNVTVEVKITFMSMVNCTIA